MWVTSRDEDDLHAHRRIFLFEMHPASQRAATLQLLPKIQFVALNGLISLIIRSLTDATPRGAA